MKVYGVRFQKLQVSEGVLSGTLRFSFHYDERRWEDVVIALGVSLDGDNPVAFFFPHKGKEAVRASFQKAGATYRFFLLDGERAAEYFLNNFFRENFQLVLDGMEELEWGDKFTPEQHDAARYLLWCLGQIPSQGD